MQTVDREEKELMRPPSLSTNNESRQKSQDALNPLKAPLLWIRCIRHYLHRDKHGDAMMRYKADIEWAVGDDIAAKYPNTLKWQSNQL